MADAKKLLDSDKLWQAYPKINDAIDNANSAKTQSDDAVNTANEAKAQSKSTQTQLDNVLIEGDSSVEAAAARVDTDGDNHPTLKDRLDSEHSSVTAQLAEKAPQTEITRIDSELADNEKKIAGRRSITDWENLVIDKGLSTEDWKDAFQAARDFLSTSVIIQELIFPSGEYQYSLSPNWAIPNISLSCEGEVLLKYTGTGNAWYLDAFESGLATDPFIDNCNMKGFSIASDTMQTGILAQGISRSKWENIRVNGSDGNDGTVGYLFKGCMLNNFNNLFCSEVHGATPYRGFMLQAGTRAGTSVGGCSNNLFQHVYPEGNAIGIQLTADGGDQNVFNVGAPESCSTYGLIVGPNCRYNTFIGLGFENLGVISADVSDSGTYTKFINCYSTEKMLLKGKGGEVHGGFFERVEITSLGENNEVKNVTVNNWGTGSGGFVNNGKGTVYRNVFDADAQTYLYKNKARFSVTVGSSPFQWTNDQNVPVKVRLYGGTVTQVIMRRGTDFWEEPLPVPGNTTDQGIYLLAPGDKIDISHSTAPSMNVIPLNNI